MSKKNCMTKKLLTIILAALLLFACLPLGAFTASAETDNLVTNCDFETGDLSGWTAYQSTQISADAAHTGNYGVQLIGNGSWNGLLTQKNISVEPNTEYAISFWYYANSRGANIQILNSSNKKILNKGFNTTGSWQRYNNSFNTGDTTTVTVNFSGAGGSGSASDPGEDVYIDDICLVKITNDGYLINGGFETGDNTGSWTFKNGAITDDAQYVHSGNYAYLMQCEGAYHLAINRGSQWTPTTCIPVEANTDYVVSFYTKGKSGTQKLYCYIKSGTSNIESEEISITADWVRHVVKFNSESYTSIYLAWQHGGTAGYVECALDDVSMYKYDGGLLDGGFETGKFTGWTSYSSTVISTDAAYSGVYGAKLAGSGWAGFLKTDTFSVEPDTEYCVSFSYKAILNGVNLAIKYSGDSSLKIPLTLQDGSTANGMYLKKQDWTRAYFTFNSGEYDSYYINFSGGGYKDGVAIESEMYLDDVKISKLSYDGYIKNGDLETGSLMSWTSYSSTEVSEEAAHSGKYGVKLHGSGSWGSTLVINNIAVEPEANYTVSFWYKAVSRGVNAKIQNGNTALKSKYCSATSWTFVSLDFDTDTATSVILNFSGPGNSENGQEIVYVDEIKLVKNNSYNAMGESGYVATGLTVNSKNPSVSFEAGETITIPGDYIVTNPYTGTESALYLWSEGDICPDGNSDVLDLIALKKYCAGISITKSGEKAAAAWVGEDSAGALILFKKALFGIN